MVTGAKLHGKEPNWAHIEGAIKAGAFSLVPDDIKPILPYLQMLDSRVTFLENELAKKKLPWWSFLKRAKKPSKMRF